MASSLASLRKRKQTISSTLKITQAMKLVSFSKYQIFLQRKKHFKSYLEAIDRVPRQALINENKTTIVFVVSPDLGLASAYTQALNKEISQHSDYAYVLVGTSLSEKLKQEKINLTNDLIKSETVDFSYYLEWIKKHIDQYNIMTLFPIYKHGSPLRFEWQSLEETLQIPYDLEVGEDVKGSILVFRQQWTAAHLYNCYLESKMVEHTIRRTTMEQASENADDILKQIDRQYNRLRQEKITQEINELIASMEG